MNKAFRLVLALCATAATLSSCSRSNYAFNPATPAYLGSQPTRTVATAPVAQPVAATPVAVAEEAPVATQTASAVAEAAPVVAKTTAPVVATPRAAAPVAAAPATQATETAPALADANVKAAKPNLAQRLVLHKLNKQLAKVQQHQNAAHTTRIGGGLAIIIVGAAIAIVGAIVSSGALAVIGGIIAIIGLVILLLSAL